MPERNEPSAASSDDRARAGRDAIDAALRALHGGVEPRRFTPVLEYALGGYDPLDAVCVHEASEPTPHWHYVTYGFTELHEKQSQLAEVSGFGFELTFRLLRGADEKEPPRWPVDLLQTLARYVFGTGNRFGIGHHMALNEPVAPDRETAIAAIAFAPDPALPPQDSPNGAFGFLQVVGVTQDEYAAMKRWTTPSVLALLEERTPRLITDLDRASILDEPAVRLAVARGIEHEGSSMDAFCADKLHWTFGDGLTITMGALEVDDVVAGLLGRVLHGRWIMARGQTGTVMFAACSEGEGCRWAAADDGDLTVLFSEELAREVVADLAPVKAGIYRWDALPDVTVIVEKSEIRDDDGNIIRVVG